MNEKKRDRMQNQNKKPIRNDSVSNGKMSSFVIESVLHIRCYDYVNQLEILMQLCGLHELEK